LSSVIWKPAVSYPDAPHEYVLFEWHPDAYAFYQVKIAEQGVDEQFTLRGRTAVYRYYYADDGYKYWIVGDVLNRARQGGETRNHTGST
jgi:hypothetical protein